MIVFRYDKTFDGLLTAVFDAYVRKTFPDKLLGEGELAPLFVEESYLVTTQAERADRVWKSVQKKLSKTSCNMITHVWLSEEEGSDELIFRYIRKNLDSKHSIEMNFADPDVLQLNQLAKKVGREAEHIRQFVRFQKAADDIFFAPISPIYNALPLSVEFFADRFADQKWIVYDMKRNYGYYYDLKNVTEIALDMDENMPDGKLDEKLMAEDEKLFQSLWKTYFKALTIKERINPKLQRQHMPQRFWKYLTEKQ
ncbi:DNA metabolism protein [Paludibacter sp. 221]|uniref:TIGR03915 family putative DNA repair protein n=1 Tax=Paludibacter sp. 221 TaxID=2302939 RepID=UPI0013D8A6B2|nr:TIGR03915 family putative DNA repair protein [Paludibacter sp. 221]NDV46458.1 DNA metabolism protein [Paludibacter sp. 221]